MIGQTISHYRITDKLGEGGMGVVYKAEDTNLKRPVALKFLAAHLLGDEEIKARFRREAEAAAGLNHPNICHVYEINEVEGKTFIAMAFLEGEGLDKKIEVGPLKFTEALAIAIQTAQGLQAAHEKKIVHRDIKPANLMITGSGSKQLVTIMDFGLALLTDRSKLTRLDETMGTVSYMSPEQTYGMELDHRTDIWSLGVVIYEMVTGQQPFKGHYDKAVMYSITNEEPEPITALRTGVPMELELLVNKCLAKDAGRRYQSTADMVVDLESLSDKLKSGKSTILRAGDPAGVGAPAGPSDIGAGVVSPAGQTNLSAEAQAGSPEPPAEPDRAAPESHPLVRYHVIEDLDSRGDSVVYRAEDTQLKRSVTINVMPESAAREAERRMRTKDRALLAGGVLFAAALVAALILAVVHFGEAPLQQRALRFSIPAAEMTESLAVSPDGRYLVFDALTLGGWQLWVRRLDSLEAQALPGTEDALLPFWSPDSTYIGFFAQGKLKKISVAGGPAQTLCDAPNGRGGTWNREDIIVFAPSPNDVLHQVSAAGGVPLPVTTLDASEGRGSHRFPRFLPDGRHFLYLTSGTTDKNGTYLASLDSKETRRLVADDSRAEYAPGASGESGHLLFVRQGALMAQPFDAGSLEMPDDLFPVAERVRVGPLPGNGVFSVSEDGVLVYQGDQAGQKLQLVWLDREGKRLDSVGEPTDYSNPALSRDGKKVAVGISDPKTSTRDLWVFDLVRGTSSRLTFDPADDLNPLWSPDGSRIVFTSSRKGRRDIWQKLASGVGDAELLFASEEPKSVEDWSLDGRFVVYNITGPFDVWALPLVGDRRPVPLLTDEFTEHQAQLSPNGRWIAYTSLDSGRPQVHVRSFSPAQNGENAAAGSKWQISRAGGLEAAWRRDGKELYYLEDQNLMAVNVTTDSAIFEVGIPKVLFEAPPLGSPRRNRYVVSADGRRFLFNVLAEESRDTSLTVMVNWRAQIQR